MNKFKICFILIVVGIVLLIISAIGFGIPKSINFNHYPLCIVLTVIGILSIIINLTALLVYCSDDYN
jgi:amino acid transporter